MGKEDSKDEEVVVSRVELEAFWKMVQEAYKIIEGRKGRRNE